MLPIVNGKLLFDCDENDLAVLIDNFDYRENDSLDYKENFSFLECPKNDPKRQKHLSEFRSDVCSFANASGGYLVYGITDSKGMASKITGIDIPDNNTDRFELERKNNLNPILPKLPSIRFRFIPLSSGKYIVIIHVQNDFFAPYMHLENDSDYKVYKREGNGKRTVGYVELKNMFNQSLSTEREVLLHRESRIRYYRSIEDTDDFRYSQFLLLHIFPDTFTDSNYNKNLFLIEKRDKIMFQNIFSSIGCSGWSIPNVDGLRFPNYRFGEECQIANNGTAECFFPLRSSLNIGEQPDKYPFGYLASNYVWEKIEPIIEKYIEIMKNVLDTKRILACISIMGCKDVVTESNFGMLYKGKIDRNTVLCQPVVFDDITKDDDVELTIKRLHLEFRLALGIKNSDEIKNLLDELYGIK